MQKIYSKVLVDLDLLRVGTIRTRLLAFYSTFGSYKGNVRVWSAEEIAIVVGHVGPDGAPSKSQEKAVSRERRKLASEGLLRKYERRVAGTVLYGWGYEPQNEIPQVALDLINTRSTKYAYCNPKDRLRLMHADRLGSLPKITMVTLSRDFPAASWFNVLSDLVDFTLPETWDFWTDKAIKAVSGKAHPLRQQFEDPNERLQIALFGLEKGFRRNLTSNRGWKARNHEAAALSYLSQSVGKEKAWTWEGDTEALLDKISEGYELLEDRALKVIETRDGPAEAEHEVEPEPEAEVSEVERSAPIPKLPRSSGSKTHQRIMKALVERGLGEVLPGLLPIAEHKVGEGVPIDEVVAWILQENAQADPGRRRVPTQPGGA